MKKHIKTEGIVLKEIPLGENGKVLTLFTKDYGKISVVAKGVKKPGSSLVQLAQLFAYSELELYKGNSSLYILMEGKLIEPFCRLSEDYDRISAAGKMAVLLLKVIQENLPDEETLSLFLNGLYFINTGKRIPEFVKIVFILKMIQIQGIAPEIEEIAYIWNKNFESGTLKALEHIFNSENKEVFSFGVSEDVLQELGAIAQVLIRELD